MVCSQRQASRKQRSQYSRVFLYIANTAVAATVFRIWSPATLHENGRVFVSTSGSQSRSMRNRDSYNDCIMSMDLIVENNPRLTVPCCNAHFCLLWIILCRYYCTISANYTTIAVHTEVPFALTLLWSQPGEDCSPKFLDHQCQRMFER